jgi:lysozyme
VWQEVSSVRTAQPGIDLIKSFEGFSETVYRCPADVPTIGYGSTWDHERKAVTMDHPDITREQGEWFLRSEVQGIEKAVGRLITAELTQGMFDALVSFTYNLGSGNLQSSTLRMKLNRGNYEGAANEFWKWRRAGGKILKGLVRRREAERQMFIGI